MNVCLILAKTTEIVPMVKTTTLANVLKDGKAAIANWVSIVWLREVQYGWEKYSVVERSTVWLREVQYGWEKYSMVERSTVWLREVQCGWENLA
jgi:hypothetical protein